VLDLFAGYVGFLDGPVTHHKVKNVHRAFFFHKTFGSNNGRGEGIGDGFDLIQFVALPLIGHGHEQVRWRDLEVGVIKQIVEELVEFILR